MARQSNRNTPRYSSNTEETVGGCQVGMLCDLCMTYAFYGFYAAKIPARVDGLFHGGQRMGERLKHHTAWGYSISLPLVSNEAIPISEIEVETDIIFAL